MDKPYHYIKQLYAIYPTLNLFCIFTSAKFFPTKYRPTIATTKIPGKIKREILSNKKDAKDPKNKVNKGNERVAPQVGQPIPSIDNKLINNPSPSNLLSTFLRCR